MYFTVLKPWRNKQKGTYYFCADKNGKNIHAKCIFDFLKKISSYCISIWLVLQIEKYVYSQQMLLKSIVLE